MAKAGQGDAGLVTPAGYKLPKGSPAGLLAEMVGTQETESGGNYYRDQIGYGHQDTPPTISDPETATEGYGAYQFTGQNAMALAAEAHNWDPWWQDKIAADQMTAYYKQYGSWQAVSEAWAAGPGGVGNPSYGSVDYANALALMHGDVSHVPQFSYEGVAGQGVSAPIPYSGGLTQGQVQSELKSGSAGTASGSTRPGSGVQGQAPQGSQGTSTAATPWGGPFGSQLEEGLFFLLGLALVVVGLVVTFKGGGDTNPAPARDAEAAAVA